MFEVEGVGVDEADEIGTILGDWDNGLIILDWPKMLCAVGVILPDWLYNIWIFDSEPYWCVWLPNGITGRLFFFKFVSLYQLMGLHIHK